MNNPTQLRSWFRRVYRGLASAALPCAIVLAPAVLASRSAQAQTYKLLYSFAGGTDGGGPYAALILDTQGNLYGTTTGGGTYSNGTVFKANKTGKEKVLYSFTGTGGDGARPYSALVRDAQGNFYGTTAFGGNPGCSLGGETGCGVVYKLSATGKEKVLYSFTGTGGDGEFPYAGLVRDAQGNLYGTTYDGGDFGCNPTYGCGTVFKVDTTRKETVLYSFTATGGDGLGPNAGLLRDGQGNLYGTTVSGGTAFGTVFKLDLSSTETVLHTFTGSTGKDGAAPYAGLVRDKLGNLYGTTVSGGTGSCTGGCGTVFKLDPSGTETVLYSFTGTGGDGEFPAAGLVLDGKGNLYGTTYAGGLASCFLGCGIVFKVDPSGTETVLYSFTGTSGDGKYPHGGLVLDKLGILYGTTYGGGATGYGTVFMLKP